MQLVISMVTALISATTLCLLFYDRIKQKKKERFRLIVSLKDKVFDCVNHRYFMYLSFSNESALPVSILDIAVGITGQMRITDNSTIFFALTSETQVTESLSRYENSIVEKYDEIASELPFVINPYSSSGCYIAFDVPRQNSAILFNQNNTLLVQTTHKELRIEMLSSGDNYRNFYYDNGKTKERFQDCRLH